MIKEKTITLALQKYNSLKLISRKGLKLAVSERETRKRRHLENRLLYWPFNYYPHWASILSPPLALLLRQKVLNPWAGAHITGARQRLADFLNTRISSKCWLQDRPYLPWMTAYMISKRFSVFGSIFRMSTHASPSTYLRWCNLFEISPTDGSVKSQDVTRLVKG